MKEIKSLIKSVLQILRFFDYIVLYVFYCVGGNVKENRIAMFSDSRATLSGNLYFIDAKIPKEKFEVLYFFKKNIREKRGLSEKKALCKALAASKYVLVDDYNPVLHALPVRKQTKVIQVWHAMGAFKTFGFSRYGKKGGPGKFSIIHRNYTDAIVSSEAIRGNYAESFRMDIAGVHALGVPRTDVFFDKDYAENTKKRIYEKYPQISGKKVVLFAPTFRGDGQKNAYYDFDSCDFNKMQQELGSEYICLFKPHPFIKDSFGESLDKSFFIDCSGEREINDLLFVTDTLITDYSSVIFEASLLKLKTVFFVPDLEEYIRDRDFFYDFSEYTFGEIARNTEELIDAVKSDDINRNYLEAFTEKFCSACDGCSSERFVRELLK